MQTLINAWLDRGLWHLGLRFAPPLEQRFEADTGPERCRTLTILGAMGCVVELLCYPALLHALPDVAHFTRALYLGVAVPVGLIAVGLMQLSPSPSVREGMQSFSNALNAVCVAYLFAISEATNDTLYVAGVLLLIIYSTLGVQLRFRFALATTAVILCAYAGGLYAMTGLSMATRRDLLVLSAAAGGFSLMANWRLEYNLRHSYLLLLTERLRRQDLSLRNLELDELVRRDALTGLANRRAYDTWLATTWAQAVADRTMIGLVIIDIDNFKIFNDFYGHAAGDACLQTVARCLRDQLRGTSDLIARLGGEEFAVLLPDLPVETCGDIAERLRAAIASLELPHCGIGPSGLVTVSAGVATAAAHELATPDALFAAADCALYAAKQCGRNRVCLASPGEAPIQPQAGLPAPFTHRQPG